VTENQEEAKILHAEVKRARIELVKMLDEEQVKPEKGGPGSHAWADIHQVVTWASGTLHWTAGWREAEVEASERHQGQTKEPGVQQPVPHDDPVPEPGAARPLV